MKNQNEVTLVAVPNMGCVGCVFSGEECGAPAAGDDFPCVVSKRDDGVEVIWVVKGTEQ